jgi:hypothetical protein
LDARRAALIGLLLAHVLLVWGSIGLLGEFWIMILFCSASRVAGLSLGLLALWLVATLSPIVGFVAVWRDRLWTVYLGLVALTLFVIWLRQFLDEVGLVYCDAP